MLQLIFTVFVRTNRTRTGIPLHRSESDNPYYNRHSKEFIENSPTFLKKDKDQTTLLLLNVVNTW